MLLRTVYRAIGGRNPGLQVSRGVTNAELSVESRALDASASDRASKLERLKAPRFLVVSMVTFAFSLLVLSRSFESASHELAVPSS
jgi:hypothetical protein